MPKEAPYIPAPRFQIASRLGAFRDTAVISDPFTSATFTIHRHNCSAYKKWLQGMIDHDPLTLLRLEGMFADDAQVLTAEESEILQSEREKANPLVPVVDRLTLSTSEQASRRTALRKLIDTGKMTPSQMASRREDDILAEAMFLLKGWDGMPDADGGMIPYDEESARALLTNDTPLEDAGLDEIILGVDAWTYEVKVPDGLQDEMKTLVEDVSGEQLTEAPRAARVIIPGLTLGLAYQHLFLRRAREASLFRDQTLGAAAKNSVPSSDGSSSSGDGSSNAAQVL